MTLGRDLTSAYHRMEALEQLARISALAHLVGEARQLSPEEIVRLENIRDVYGTDDKNVPCFQCGWEPRRPGEPPLADSPTLAPIPAHASGPSSPAATPARGGGYTDPGVHWPGNPPVWDRRANSATEADVRNLARRALREVRRGESDT